MKKMWLRFISLTLAVVMIAASLAGCGSKVDEEGIEGQASAVPYNTGGRFTTTVAAENAKFAENIKVEDITVTYAVLDEESYAKALESKGKAEEGKVDSNDYFTDVKANVESVVRKDEKTLEITFSDDQAKANIPFCYDIVIEKGKTGVGKVIGAASHVVYPDNTLTPNLTSVSVLDKDIRLTLALTEGEFSANVSKEQIELGGSFKNLNIDSISAAGKNLTMQLNGNITKEETMNAYLNGFVTISKEAIINGYKSVSVTIPVDTDYFGFELEKMAVAKNQVSVPVNIGGYRFADDANAADVQIEGVTVAGFDVVSGTSAVLKLNLPDANDKNSAASILNGKTVTLSANALGTDEAVSFEADFNHADFYPVFDYADEKDGKYAITLMLYAISGSFEENLKTDMVALSDDFANATVTSFKRENNSTAELILSVDSNGVKVEDMDLTGTVTLKNGALVSRWGDAYIQECSQTRSYTEDSMGKDLNEDDINVIKDIVGGFGNTKMGTLVAIGSGLVSGVSGAYTLLEVVGVIESQKAKLDKIYRAIQQISSQLCDIETAIRDQNAVAAAKEISDFYENKLNLLLSSMQYAKSAVSDTKGELKEQGVNEPAQALEYDKDGKCTSSTALQDEWKTYLGAVMKRVRENRSGEFNILRVRFEAVCGCLKQNNSVSSIIEKFDQHMSYYYNFDTSAYTDRENFRKNLSAAISMAALELCMYNQYGFESPATYTIETLDDMYIKAKQFIDSKPVTRRTDGKVLMMINNVTLYNNLGYSANQGSAFTSYKYDLSDAEAEQFVKRMHGRTIEEELDLAEMSLDYGSDKTNVKEKTIGVALNCWSRRDGAWHIYNHYTNYYSNIILWGDNKVSYNYCVGKKENGWNVDVALWRDKMLD